MQRSQSTKATQSKSLQAGSISVTANLGLVNIPNSAESFYVLPSQQDVASTTGKATEVFVSVYTESTTTGFTLLGLVDESGVPLNAKIQGTLQTAPNSVNTYMITIPADKVIQRVYAKSNNCGVLSNCSNEALVNLSNINNGILAIQPNYFDMSPSYESQVITLQNIGNGTITSLTMPSLPNGFSILPNSNTCKSTLSPNQTCQLTLVYTPSNTSGQASLVINYNNGVQNANTSVTIPYQGISPSGYAILTPNPTSFALSESHPLQVIALRNTGTAGLTALTLPTLTAPLQESTVGVLNACTANQSLAINQSCNYAVYVDYTQAQAAGSESVTFTYNNGQQTQTTNVAAQWSASTPRVAMLSASPSSFDLSESKPYQVITLTNTGNAPATSLTMPTLNAPLAESGMTNCSAILAESASCSYIVAIDYSGVFPESSQILTFSYNNGQQVAESVPVTANWVGHSLSLYMITTSVDYSRNDLLKCNVTESGGIANCGLQSSPGSGFRTMTFDNSSGTWYAYFAMNAQYGFIERCDYNTQSGDISNCINASGVVAGLGAGVNSVTFRTAQNGTKYAYIISGGAYASGNNNGIYKCDISDSGMLTNCANIYSYGNIDSYTNLVSLNVTFQNISGIDYIYFTNWDTYALNNSSVVCQMNNDGTVNAPSCAAANFPIGVTPPQGYYAAWWYLTQYVNSTIYQYITDAGGSGLYRCQAGSDGTYSNCSLLSGATPNQQFDIATNLMGNMYLFLPVASSNGVISYQLTNNGGTATAVHQYTNESFGYPMAKVLGVVLQPHSH